ncbi:hypothetical protein [Polaribacter sp.]|uniref:hypothetical protein n=1 Tax=Polaribacter sp. TaxID=1920175 RepID=UPI003EF2B91D
MTLLFINIKDILPVKDKFTRINYGFPEEEIQNNPGRILNLAIKNNLLSVDYLEKQKDNGLAILKKSDKMPVLFYSDSFLLNTNNTLAKKIIDVNLPIAQATDYILDATFSENKNFVFSTASIKIKTTAEEATNTSTTNDAFSTDLKK